MGRSGDLLRQNKKKSTVYTFTAEQLLLRDQRLLMEHKKQIADDCSRKLEEEFKDRKKAFDAEIEKVWKEREEIFKSGMPVDNIETMTLYALSLSAKVLIEHFDFAPLRDDGRYVNNMKIVKFGNLVMDEMNKISSDDTADIRTYCDEIYEKYGIRYARLTDKLQENV